VFGDRYIATVRGRGYQLVADVRTAAEHALTAAAQTPRRRWRRAAGFGIAAAMVCSVTLILVARHGGMPGGQAAEPMCTCTWGTSP
jgi:hypothetical protein